MESAINAFGMIKKYLDEQTIRNLVLPKAKTLFIKASNVRTRLIALQCIDKLLDSLEKMVILDDVLPFLIEIQCGDVDIVMSIISIYKHLLADKKFGLTHNLLATKVMPSLVPLTVYPGLSINQFNSLMEILHDMLSQIEHQRLNKMINELPTPEAVFDRQRRTSADMKRLSNKFLFGPHSAAGLPSFMNQSLLNVDFNAYRPPSTPEFPINSASSREQIDNASYKRHASFQSLGMAEHAVFEMVRQRRLSQMSSANSERSRANSLFAAANNPHIHISQASVSGGNNLLGTMGGGFKENVANLFGVGGGSNSSRHRDSTVSIGPIIIPDFGRRESSGKLFGRDYNSTRRSSFQGICESAMQYFGVK